MTASHASDGLGADRGDGPPPPAAGGPWRLLVDPPAGAAWNMAVDEAVATAVGAGQAPNTLRLYAWRPPAVSVGYFQRLRAEVDLAACRERGIEWVRRPTGGRAVLHDRELTYAVMERARGSVVELYERWSGGLIAGLKLLGVPAGWAEPTRGRSSACFDALSVREIAVGGKKLVGSAQTRRWGAVLQHGSLPLALDRAAHASVLRGGPEMVATLEERACALGEVLAKPPTWDEAAQALAAGFASALGIELLPGSLSSAEECQAVRLAQEKYGTEAWNARR